MKADKVEKFIKLAGREVADNVNEGSQQDRILGAHLLFSEVLEYLILGLGIQPEIGGVRITNPEDIKYVQSDSAPNKVEMLDGLADVAYTMYWNAATFGLPLEEAYQAVCDNNLEKFVQLKDWQDAQAELPQEQWDCGQGISWPEEVASVSVVCVDQQYYAVGKDQRGKVRKPSSYRPVELAALVL